MKIGLVSSYMPPHLGGLEQIGETLFQGYARRGLRVEWIASCVPSGLPARDGGRVRVACWNGVERWLGVPVPLWGPEAWREVERLARWADALHVLECLYVSSAMAIAAGRRHGKPVVVSQNIGFIAYRSAVLNAIERLAYGTLGRAVLRRASHVVLATPSAKRDVLPMLDGTPASAFPVGIDTERFRPASADDRARARRPLGLPAAEPVVLFAGRLVEKKGLPLVVEVARRLDGVRFLVVGDGPLRRLLDGAPANIVWHRAVDPSNMPAVYHAVDGVLLPSHGEGLPLVIQEAMASGLPCVVSSDEPYAADLVAADVCLAAPRGAGAMANALERALACPDALPRRARSYAEVHWSADAMVDRHVALFEELMATPRVAPPA